MTNVLKISFESFPCGFNFTKLQRINIEFLNNKDHMVFAFQQTGLKSFMIDAGTLWDIGIILLVTIVLAYLYNRIANRYIQKILITHDKDLTGFQFVKHAITALIYVLGIAAALSQIPDLKTLGHSLLAGAGILSVVVGLAAQQSLGNLFSGIMIVIFKPFRINDRVTINDKTGFVEDINLRQVVLRDFENNRIIIPNTLVNSEVIINNQMNDPKVCNKFTIGIGYSSDIDKAFAIIRKEAEKHPLHIDNRSADDKKNNVPAVIVRVVELADSSVNLTAWIWSANKGDGFVMLCDLMKSVKERFDNEGIEIPFPQRTISYAKTDKKT